MDSARFRSILRRRDIVGAVAALLETGRISPVSEQSEILAAAFAFAASAENGALSMSHMDKRMPKMSPKSSPAGALIERAIRAIDDGDWAALERCASTLTKYGNIDESAIRAAVNNRGTDLVKLLE